MSIQRSGRIAALLVASVVVFGACSSGSSTSAAPSSAASATPQASVAPSAAPSASAAPSLAGVTLTLWRKDYDNAGIDAINAAFETKTGVKIDVTKIPAPGTDNVLPKWTAGDRPDVLYLEGFASTIAKLNAKESLQPLDDAAFVANITPELKDFGVLDGVRYWAPLTAPSINGLLYNKKVVAKLGLTIPTNLPELLTFCEQAKAKGTTAMIIGEKDQFPAWATVNAMTSDFLVENPDFAKGLAAGTEKFTNPEYVKRFQALADLKAKGCFEDQGEAVDFSTSMKMFMAGDGAIFNCASFCIPDLIGATDAATVNETVGLLPISYAKPALWLYGGDDSGMYLTKSGNATQEAAARAYMDFALGEGYDLYLNAMHENSRYPTVHPVSDPSAVVTPIREGAEALAASTPGAAAIEPLLVCFPSYSDYFTLLAELYTGDKTAMAVAEGLQAGFDQTCKDLGIAGF